MATDDKPDLDGLAARLLGEIKKLGGRRQDESPDLEDLEVSGARAVPMAAHLSRVTRERERRQAAETALEALRGQVEELMGGYKARESQLRDEATVAVRDVTARFQEDMALRDLDVTDPLGRQTIRAHWDALPKDGRGRSPSDWWKGHIDAVKAAQADPKAAQMPETPRALSAYLPPAPDPGAGRSRATGGGAPPAPPGPARHVALDAIPVDQGIDAFISRLRGLEP